MRGVYRSVFEQSLLLNQDPKRPWNFLASLSVEVLVVSLALIIPLLYHDHLPIVHWKDIMVGPAPLEPSPVQKPAAHSSGPASLAPSSTPHRQFIWNPKASSNNTPQIDVATDAPPTLGISQGGGGANNNMGTFVTNYVAGPPPPKPPTPVKQPSAPVAVSSGVQMAMLIRKVIPVYPPLARSARISGIVHLVGTIGKDGTVQNLEVVSGHPMLARAALEAVRQWVYKPTLLNGTPVEVIAPIEVTFTLGQ